MKTDPDDATRLMNLLVAICGDQIRDYRPQLEALAHKFVRRQPRAGGFASMTTRSTIRRC
jgi:hypothetical protein